MPIITWEPFETDHITLYRIKVPGGWLVAMMDTAARSMTYVPDVKHEWKV